MCNNAGFLWHQKSVRALMRNLYTCVCYTCVCYTCVCIDYALEVPRKLLTLKRIKQAS